MARNWWLRREKFSNLIKRINAVLKICNSMIKNYIPLIIKAIHYQCRKLLNNEQNKKFFKFLTLPFFTFIFLFFIINLESSSNIKNNTVIDVQFLKKYQKFQTNYFANYNLVFKKMMPERMHQCPCVLDSEQVFDELSIKSNQSFFTNQCLDFK